MLPGVLLIILVGPGFYGTLSLGAPIGEQNKCYNRRSAFKEATNKESNSSLPRWRKWTQCCLLNVPSRGLAKFFNTADLQQHTAQPMLIIMADSEPCALLAP